MALRRMPEIWSLLPASCSGSRLSLGGKGAEKIANEIGAFVNVKIINLPEGKDPDSLSIKELKEIKNLIK